MAFLWEAVVVAALEEVEVVQGEGVVTLRSPEFEDHLQLFEMHHRPLSYPRHHHLRVPNSSKHSPKSRKVQIPSDGKSTTDDEFTDLTIEFRTHVESMISTETVSDVMYL